MEDEDNIDVFQHQTGGGISLSLRCSTFLPVMWLDPLLGLSWNSISIVTVIIPFPFLSCAEIKHLTTSNVIKYIPTNCVWRYLVTLLNKHQLILLYFWCHEIHYHYSHLFSLYYKTHVYLRTSTGFYFTRYVHRITIN